MQKRRPRGSIPVEIHQIILSEYKRTGAVPPAIYLAKVTGINPVLVRRALRTLVDSGVVIQPYGEKTSYVPALELDGSPFKLAK